MKYVDRTFSELLQTWSGMKPLWTDYSSDIVTLVTVVAVMIVVTDVTVMTLVTVVTIVTKQ